MGMFGGLGKMFGSFGTVPDILMGKDPKEALLDNLKMAAIVGTGMYAAPLLGAGAAGAGAAGSAAGTAGAEAASTGLLAEPFAGATLGSGSAQLGTSGLLGTGTAASGTMAPEMAGTMMGQGSMSSAGASMAQPGLLDTFTKYAKPVQTVMDAAQQAQGPEQAPMHAPQLQRPPVDMNGILQQGQEQQQMTQQDNERRKQLMAQFYGRGY